MYIYTSSPLTLAVADQNFSEGDANPKNRMKIRKLFQFHLIRQWLETFHEIGDGTFTGALWTYINSG